MKISLQKASKPDEIALDRRLIEAVFLLEKLDSRLVDALSLGLQLGHVAFEVVARGQLHDRKHERAGEQQRRNHDQNATENVEEHG